MTPIRPFIVQCYGMSIDHMEARTLAEAKRKVRAKYAPDPTLAVWWDGVTYPLAKS